MDWTEAHLQGDLEAMQQAREEAIVRAALERAALVASRYNVNRGAGSATARAVTTAIRALAESRDEINAILLKAAGEDRG